MSRYNAQTTQTALTNDQMMRVAPSIFANEAHNSMSSRYAFIPTIQIVDKMRNEGFQPFSVAQSISRVPGKQAFTKHLIRFRDTRNGNAPAIRSLGGLFPELVLTNSHDGASTYRIDAGFFRCVCINGLMVGDTVDSLKVRHTGSADGIIEASYQIVDQFPKALASIEKFAALQLNPGQREAFAAAALELKYDEQNPAPIAAAQILRPKRSDDVDPTLWNTFNTVQEHLITGGVRGRNPETRRNLRTRAVNGISENTKLNKALWTLTEKMKELVG